MKHLLSLLLGLLAICAPRLAAEDNAEAPQPLRPVTSAYTLDLGSASMADTYLSPITYRGWNIGLGYERMQAMRFDPQRWVMQLDGRLDYARGRNHADNATMWMADFDLRWGMMRRWRLPHSLTLAVGGSTGIDVGCLYNARNSNNPASAKAAWTVNLTAMASWNTHIGRLPITLRYEPTLPLVGVFFSPEYDELYYEISLGNNKGLAHFAQPFNRFAMINYLTADLRLGSTSLRLGYRSTILSSKVNNLTTNVFTHSFVIGITGEWINLPRTGHISADAATISALY